MDIFILGLCIEYFSIPFMVRTTSHSFLSLSFLLLLLHFMFQICHVPCKLISIAAPLNDSLVIYDVLLPDDSNHLFQFLFIYIYLFCIEYFLILNGYPQIAIILVYAASFRFSWKANIFIRQLMNYLLQAKELYKATGFRIIKNA